MNGKETELTRRGFLGRAATGLAAASLATLTPGRLGAAEIKGDIKEIITRKLGKNGMEVPVISMGVMNANNPSVVQASYERGVRLFDTAAYYQFGRNELMVGSVISKLGVRDKVVIGTKIYTSQQRVADPKEAKKKFIKLAEGSLSRLKTDYVDILYVHDVSAAEDFNNPGILEAITVLKEQKKIKLAGVATHSNMAGVLNAVVDGGFYDTALIGVNFTQADDADYIKAIKKASDNGVGLVGMKNLAGGSRWPNPETRRIYSSETIAKAALKWVLNLNGMTTCIPGYDNHEHLEQNFSVAYDLEYTDDEKKFLADNNVAVSMGYCRQCKKCLASCPNDVDVPTLMRVHMYTAQYTNFIHARQTLNDIPSKNNLTNCSLCTTCTAKCANSVDIGRRIDELKLIYA